MKFWLSTLFLILIKGASGQSNYSARTQLITAETDINSTRQSRASFWSEDFANGLFGNNGDGAWTTSGPDSAVWKHSFFGTSGEFSAGTPQPNTTSVGNGFMLFDADSVNFPNSPNYQHLTGSLISPRIDLSSQGSVVINFEHWFQFCCLKTGPWLTLGISNDDGQSWTEINIDGNVSASTPIANPTTVSFNISPYAANHDSVRLRFSWTNVSHYFWVIDDINLEEAPPHDLELVDFVWETDYVGHPGYTTHGLHYTTVPAQDDYTFLFSGTAINQGALSANTWLKLEVSNSSGVIANLYSDTMMLLPNTDFRDTLSYQLPSMVDDYTFKLFAMMDSSALDVNDNESDSVAISASGQDVMFSKDNNMSSNIGFWNGDDGAGTSNPFELVTAYRFKEEAQFCALDVYFHPSSDVGALVYPVVYEVDTSFGNFNLIYIGHDYVVDANYHETMLIENNGSIYWDTAATYLFGVGHYGGPDKLVVLMSDHKPELDQSTFYYDPTPIGGPWYETSRAPFIRPYYGSWSCFGSTTNLEEVSLSLHPNPSSNNIYLNWKASFDVQTYRITSLDGKLLKHGKISPSNHELNLDCSAFNNGLYTITLQGLTELVSKQFVIAK